MAPVLHVTSVPWIETPNDPRTIDGAPWCRRPLASLHANPAHSALRRARHFDAAATSVARRIDYESMRAITARIRYLMAVRGSYGSARIVSTWSVR